MDKKYAHLNGVYKEIAEEFDLDTSQRFHKLFKGLNVNFPIRFLDRQYVIENMRKEYDGKNLKTIARKYGYSERWVRKIINEDVKLENCDR